MNVVLWWAMLVAIYSVIDVSIVAEQLDFPESWVLQHSIFVVWQVPQQSKLPSLYLLDSIVKNVGGEYLHLVAQIMEKTFTCVFEKVFAYCYIFWGYHCLERSSPFSLYLSVVLANKVFFKSTFKLWKVNWFNMTQTWDKENSESRTRIEPMTSWTHGGCSIHWPKRTHESNAMRAVHFNNPYPTRILSAWDVELSSAGYLKVLVDYFQICGEHCTCFKTNG